MPKPRWSTPGGNKPLFGETLQSKLREKLEEQIAAKTTRIIPDVMDALMRNAAPKEADPALNYMARGVRGSMLETGSESIKRTAKGSFEAWQTKGNKRSRYQYAKDAADAIRIYKRQGIDLPDFSGGSSSDDYDYAAGLAAFPTNKMIPHAGDLKDKWKYFSQYKPMREFGEQNFYRSYLRNALDSTYRERRFHEILGEANFKLPVLDYGEDEIVDFSRGKQTAQQVEAERRRTTSDHSAAQGQQSLDGFLIPGGNQGAEEYDENRDELEELLAEAEAHEKNMSEWDRFVAEGRRMYEARKAKAAADAAAGPFDPADKADAGKAVQDDVPNEPAKKAPIWSAEPPPVSMRPRTTEFSEPLVGDEISRADYGEHIAESMELGPVPGELGEIKGEPKRTCGAFYLGGYLPSLKSGVVGLTNEASKRAIGLAGCSVIFHTAARWPSPRSMVADFLTHYTLVQYPEYEQMVRTLDYERRSREYAHPVGVAFTEDGVNTDPKTHEIGLGYQGASDKENGVPWALSFVPSHGLSSTATRIGRVVFGKYLKLQFVLFSATREFANPRNPQVPFHSEYFGLLPETVARMTPGVPGFNYPYERLGFAGFNSPDVGFNTRMYGAGAADVRKFGFAYDSSSNTHYPVQEMSIQQRPVPTHHRLIVLLVPPNLLVSWSDLASDPRDIFSPIRLSSLGALKVLLDRHYFTTSDQTYCQEVVQLKGRSFSFDFQDSVTIPIGYHIMPLYVTQIVGLPTFLKHSHELYIPFGSSIGDTDFTDPQEIRPYGSLIVDAETNMFLETPPPQIIGPSSTNVPGILSTPDFYAKNHVYMESLYEHKHGCIRCSYTFAYTDL